MLELEMDQAMALPPHTHPYPYVIIRVYNKSNSGTLPANSVKLTYHSVAQHIGRWVEDNFGSFSLMQMSSASSTFHSATQNTHFHRHCCCCNRSQPSINLETDIVWRFTCRKHLSIFVNVAEMYIDVVFCTNEIINCLDWFYLLSVVIVTFRAVFTSTTKHL